MTKNWITRSTRGLLVAAICLSGLANAQSVSLEPPATDNVVLPDKPKGAHWVWLGDYGYGNYGRSMLLDAGTGKLLGTLDTGWEGARLIFARGQIYNAAMFMSRGFRGERTDVLTAYDRHTLNPLYEIIVPPKTIRGFQDMNHFTVTDDEAFAMLQLSSPAFSAGIVDLEKKAYLGEIETAGCVNLMPAGKRRFFSLCGDGSLLSVSFADDGKEVSRKRYQKFFDADADPLHESGVRSGNIWYFVSHLGKIHPVDVSGEEFKPLPVWSVSEKDGDKTWIPGQPMQTLAVHQRRQHLLVLMHASDLQPKYSGPDYHRQPGTEVRVFDIKTQKLLQRVALDVPTDAINVSQDESPLLYASSLFHLEFHIHELASGKRLHKIPVPGYPHLVQPVDD